MLDLRSQLEREEDRRRHVYRDTRGILTIGIGRNVDRDAGGPGLRDVEMDFMLDNDIAEATAEVIEALPWAASLSPARMAVLIGMRFQMGLAGLLGFRQALASVRDERYADAGARMLQSRWAQQTPGRAHRMSRQMETGEWQA